MWHCQYYVYWQYHIYIYVVIAYVFVIKQFWQTIRRVYKTSEVIAIAISSIWLFRRIAARNIYCVQNQHNNNNLSVLFYQFDSAFFMQVLNIVGFLSFSRLYFCVGVFMWIKFGFDLEQFANKNWIRKRFETHLGFYFRFAAIKIKIIINN